MFPEVRPNTPPERTTPRTGSFPSPTGSRNFRSAPTSTSPRPHREGSRSGPSSLFPDPRSRQKREGGEFSRRTVPQRVRPCAEVNVGSLGLSSPTGPPPSAPGCPREGRTRDSTLGWDRPRATGGSPETGGPTWGTPLLRGEPDRDVEPDRSSTVEVDQEGTDTGTRRSDRTGVREDLSPHSSLRSGSSIPPEPHV